MTKKEITIRYLLFIVSLFFIGLGIAFTKRSDLGVSPISSVANVLSCKFTALSMGTWLTISNLTMLLGQVLLLRKRFQPIQLLQIPLSFLFGYFTDFGMWIASLFPNEFYLARLGLVFVGIIILGFGIALSIVANVLLNSGEAFVKALADVLDKEFGDIKVIFDVLWVLLSILLSMLLFEGRLVGVREGTLISAVFTGMVAKWFRPMLAKFLHFCIHNVTKTP